MLRAPALSRLAEAWRLLLAIHDEGLLITIDDAEGIRKRLLGQDNIIIIQMSRISAYTGSSSPRANTTLRDTLLIVDASRVPEYLTSLCFGTV